MFVMNPDYIKELFSPDSATLLFGAGRRDDDASGSRG